MSASLCEVSMQRAYHLSEFLKYLANCAPENETAQLPSLNGLSKELGVSISVLREQVEVAKSLGLVEVRPRTGMRRLPYSFFPAVRNSLAYALKLSMKNFRYFADLRNHVEAIYWEEAVTALNEDDRHELRSYVEHAWKKLSGSPIQIPHEEHRQFHLSIYRRLDNPYVHGILLAYWDAYEVVGLSLYTDYEYLRQVWLYHQQMIDSLCEGDIQKGYQALITHRDLYFQRADINLIDSKSLSME